jgi:hypothetical protein
MYFEVSHLRCVFPYVKQFNPLNPELNPICYLLALLGAHHFLHVSTIRVKSLTLRLLMSYIYIYIYIYICDVSNLRVNPVLLCKFLNNNHLVRMEVEVLVKNSTNRTI